MTSDTEDDRGPFDAETVERVATEYDVGPARLRDVVDSHQTAVAALPGVENLAYEWRKHHDDPLIERTEETFAFAVPVRVWAEFAESLSLTDDERLALAAVHRRAVARRTDADPEPPDGSAYVLLDRTADDGA